MEHTNGRYKVVWLRPGEDSEDDVYHSISSYTNGRAHMFMHTRSEEKAKWLFNNQCAMVDGFDKRHRSTGI